MPLTLTLHLATTGLTISGVLRLVKAVIPNLFGTRDRFRGRQFFHGSWWGDGFGMVQAHYIYCVLYFYYYYIVIYNYTTHHNADRRQSSGGNASDGEWL